MQPIIDEFLEPHFRSKNKKKECSSPLNIILCYEQLLKKEVGDEK